MLALAFCISVVIHLLCYGGYELGKEFGIWKIVKLPVWLHKPGTVASTAKNQQKPPEPQAMPLVFVDVNPDLATPEPPKNAKFYSNKNSVAANPDADKETEQPKITGKQTEVAKTEDTPRADFDKLQPSLPHAERNAPEQAKPSSAAPPGDIAMAKPDTQLRQSKGTAEEARPRTIREALMRQHRNQLVGQKMKQQGGVGRFRLQASFDAKATPFGDYDAAFIQAVQSRWYALLDSISFESYRRGKVVLRFHLDYNGDITDMKVLDNGVGDMLSLLCEKAVLDPAPFDKWPRDMRLMVDRNYREITFTFYYD